MGEIADAIINGEFCQYCGIYMDSESNGEGFPQTCPDCIGDDSLKTYVTFGTDHNHKINGKYIDHRNVAVIKCKNEDHGRQLAFDFFGVKFCMEYHEDYFVTKPKYFPNGFVSVN